jgi:hypothetical protein
VSYSVPAVVAAQLGSVTSIILTALRVAQLAGRRSLSIASIAAAEIPRALSAAPSHN